MERRPTRWDRERRAWQGGSGRVISDRVVSVRAGLERRGVTLRVSASDRLDEAVRAAEGADVVVACGGGHTAEESDRYNALEEGGTARSHQEP